MKLVLVGDYPLNAAYGGVGQYIYCLASALADYEDIEVNVLTYSDKKYVFRENNFTVHTVDRNSNLPRILTIYNDTINMQRTIGMLDPDLVHVSGFHYPYNFLCKRIKGEYPLLVTLHSYAGHEMWYVPPVHMLNSLINYVLEERTLRNINDITVCSTSMKQLIQRKSDAKIYVVPNGAIITDIQDNSCICADKIIHPSILFLGRLEKIKGIEVLIRAIPVIRKNIPNIHVYLAGDGYEVKNIKRLVKKLRIGAYVTFLGYIVGAKKCSYIKSTDLFIAPSYHESFGLSILEAMACGKAIVASNADNIPCLIEDGKEGVLVNPGDYQELAAKIIQVLLSRDHGNTMGFNARQKAANYTWNNTAKMTYEVYKKILGNGF